MRASGRAATWVGAATALMCLMGSSGALAQSCASLTLGGNTSFLGALGTGLSAGVAVASAVSAANTAFLTQSTAFVSAPGNPKPYSEGSGVWVRGVGGELSTSTTTVVNAATTNPGVGTFTGSTTCNSQFHQSFGGFQLGQDVAELNVNGWNIHLGTTAGFLQTTGNIVGGNVAGGYFNSTTEAPFIGTYGVATYGNFYVDGLIRYDYFQTQLNSPTVNLFNQSIDAHGFTVSASTGYNYKVPNSAWFIEPSMGVVWSKEMVDPFNGASPPFNSSGATNGTIPFSGTENVNDINSILGRAGARVGTTLKSGDIVFQPFFAASVWHDFGSNITATYSACNNCIFYGPRVGTLTSTMSSNNIGTFGQYSVGVAGQLTGTGWLGFARVDYREGPNMSGLSGTGGIRYQFTPGAAPAMPVKAPVVEVVNWAGWYAGAIGGAEAGHGSMYFPNSAFISTAAGIPLTQQAGGSGSNLRPAGALGGLTLGYNWQAGRIVYGLEADGAWTGVQSSSQCAPLNPPLVAGINPNSSGFQQTCHDNMNWSATVAARLGYVWNPHTLIYAKAGVAVAEETFSATCNSGPLNGQLFAGTGENCVNASGAFVNNASASTTAVGWMLGYGTEFALTAHWTAKAEFDWTEFGHKSVVLSDGSAINTYQSVAQAKVGVNYKW
jgi:outer membrane autotransporter protein